MAPIVPTLRHERRLWNDGPRPGRRRRRGRRRADLRRGRRGGGDHAAGLPSDPGRPRLQDPVGRPARAPRADHPRAGGRGRRRRGVGPRDRPAQHLSRDAPRDAPRDRAGRRPRARPGRRQPDRRVRGARRAVHEHRRRRRQGLLDRLRVGRRQGRPRPDDGAAVGSLSGLRLGAQPGLRDAGAPDGDPPAGADAVPSPLVPGAPADARRRPARLRPAGRSGGVRARRTSCWPAS